MSKGNIAIELTPYQVQKLKALLSDRSPFWTGRTINTFEIILAKIEGQERRAEIAEREKQAEAQP